MNNLIIREAILSDSPFLSDLSNSLACYLFDESVPKWFKEELSCESFKQRVLSDEYMHFIYIQDKKIVGFIAIKDKNHLFHLFVDKKYHRQGIATKLWEFVKVKIDVSNMLVNASLYGIKAYESFGFEISDEEKQYLQLKFQPMIFKKV